MVYVKRCGDHHPVVKIDHDEETNTLVVMFGKKTGENSTLPQDTFESILLSHKKSSLMAVGEDEGFFTDRSQVKVIDRDSSSDNVFLEI